MNAQARLNLCCLHNYAISTLFWVSLLKQFVNLQTYTSQHLYVDGCYKDFFFFLMDKGFTLFASIYTFGVFTEKPYSKPLEHNTVYIPVTTSGHGMSMMSK